MFRGRHSLFRDHKFWPHMCMCVSIIQYATRTVVSDHFCQCACLFFFSFPSFSLFYFQPKWTRCRRIHAAVINMSIVRISSTNLTRFFQWCKWNVLISIFHGHGVKCACSMIIYCSCGFTRNSSNFIRFSMLKVSFHFSVIIALKFCRCLEKCVTFPMKNHILMMPYHVLFASSQSSPVSIGSLLKLRERRQQTNKPTRTTSIDSGKFCEISTDAPFILAFSSFEKTLCHKFALKCF